MRYATSYYSVLTGLHHGYTFDTFAEALASYDVLLKDTDAEDVEDVCLNAIGPIVRYVVSYTSAISEHPQSHSFDSYEEALGEFKELFPNNLVKNLSFDEIG